MADTISTAFVLGAGFSAAEQFPLVRGLRERVLHFLEAEQHSAYRVFLTAGNGGFSEGQFRAGLKAIDPNETLAFEELLIELSKRRRQPKMKTRALLRNAFFVSAVRGSYGAFKIRYGVPVPPIRTLHHGCAATPATA
jgi:hypothetical protein